MNPSDSNTPPVVRRFPLTTLLLLCSLVVYFVWFLFMHFQESQSEATTRKWTAALTKKDVVHARALFEDFLHLHPTDPLPYMEISKFCAEFDQPALAVEYAQRGIDACKNAPAPQRAGLYLSLAQAQSLAAPAHPQTGAIASVRTALSLDPQNPVLQNAAGYMLADNDQSLDEAEKLLRQALQSLKQPGADLLSDELRPDMEDSFGWLLYKKGDYTGALAALNQASHHLPSGEPGYIAKYFYYHLGAAYRKAGQTDEARRTLAVALQYDPAFPEAKAEEALLPPQNTPAASPRDTPPAGPSVVPPSSAATGLKF